MSDLTNFKAFMLFQLTETIPQIVSDVIIFAVSKWLNS